MASDGPGCTLIIPGEHYHLDSHILQFTHSLGTVLLDHISHRNNAHKNIIPAEEQRRLPLLRQGLGPGGQILRDSRDKPAVSAFEHSAVQDSGQAISRKRLKVRNLSGLKLLLSGLFQNRSGKGMLALFLQSVSHGEKFLLCHMLCGDNIRHFRLSACDGSRLIQCHNLCLSCFLQGNRSLKEDSVLCAQAISYHNSHRGGQSQSAGAADYQHGNPPCQSEPHGLSGQQPADNGNHRNGDNRRDKDARHLIRHLGNRRLGSRRIADHLNNLGQCGVLAHPGGLAADKSRLVQRSRRHMVSRSLIYRYTLSCEGRLIDRAVSLQHHAVHRDIFARAHNEDVSLIYLVHRNLCLHAVPHHNRGLGSQLHKPL